MFQVRSDFIEKYNLKQKTIQAIMALEENLEKYFSDNFNIEKHN